MIVKRRKKNGKRKKNGEKDIDCLCINSASALPFQTELVCPKRKLAEENPFCIDLMSTPHAQLGLLDLSQSAVILKAAECNYHNDDHVTE